MRQVCGALDFAHRHGVLHRDLEPPNVMIATRGSSRALLLDFGLVRGALSDKLTRTGSKVGFLRHMAAE